jgi:transcriptional regulator with XRE-family HTH domain
MPPRPFGPRLTRLRRRQKVTQLELSRRTGVGQGYISSLESGRKRNPGLVTLRKLAQGLGVPLRTLLE